MLVLRIIYYLLFTNYFYKPYRPMQWHTVYKRYRSASVAYRRQKREETLISNWPDEAVRYARHFWGHRCAVCRQSVRLERDHLVPVASAHCPGAVPSNLLLLCKKCNQDKSAQDFACWYEMTFKRSAKFLILKIWQWQYYCLCKGWR